MGKSKTKNAEEKPATTTATTDDIFIPDDTEVSEDSATPSAEILEPIAPTLSKNEMQVIRTRILDRRTQIEEGYFDLAQDLCIVWEQSLYTEWGFDSFAAYVETELDFRLRSAQYMVSIADWFGKMPPEIKEWVKGLGWSKAKELVGKVDESNWTTWKSKIAGKSVSQIKEILSAKDASKEKEPKPEEFKRRAFRLAPAQWENVDASLTKAKEDAQTDSDAHALDLICTEFLGSHQGASDLAGYLARIEKSFGVRLVAYSPAENAVVYGVKLLDELAETEVEEEAPVGDTDGLAGE